MNRIEFGEVSVAEIREAMKKNHAPHVYRR